MKTTVDIAEALLKEARKVAARDGTTLRLLIEEGLRRVVAERRGPAAFRLRRASFKGGGRRPEVAGAAWDDIRKLAYEDRGT